MRTKKFNWVLNVLTLVAMAVALVLAPMSPASADIAALEEEFMRAWANPCHANAEVYYRFDLKITSGLAAGGEEDFIAIQFKTGYPAPPDKIPVDTVGVTNVAPSHAISLTEGTQTGEDGTVANSCADGTGLGGECDQVYPGEVDYEPWNYDDTPGGAFVNADGTLKQDVTVQVWPMQALRSLQAVKIEFFGPDRTNPTQEDVETNRPHVDLDPSGARHWLLNPYGDEDAFGNVGVPDADDGLFEDAGFRSPAINPDDGLPMEPGDVYTLTIWTSEDDTPKRDRIIEICAPPPVALYLKQQIPEENCGWTDLDLVAHFYSIREALDAADMIWMQEGDYAQYPRWNLFDDCPNLPDAVPGDIPPNAKWAGGVYVGAVIEVDGDIKSVFTETLYIDTPGLMVGAKHGTDVTLDVEGIWPVDVAGYNGFFAAGLPGTPTFDPPPGGSLAEGWPGAVGIYAGGVTFGEGQILVEDDAVFQLDGFTLMGAGQDVPHTHNSFLGDVDPPTDWDAPFEADDYWDEDADGVAVYPNGHKCVPGVYVYDGDSVLDVTVISTATQTITQALDALVLGTENYKIVNLTKGWSAYEFDGDYYLIQPYVIPGGAIGDLTEYFLNGHVVAVFAPTTYECMDARVDIRGNTISTGTFAGIGAYSTAIWVDGNTVYDNDTDGFYGEDLKCCNSLRICDGANRGDLTGALEALGRTDKMLELSDNNFYHNGDGAASSWLGAGNCFDPETGSGDDSGIEIMSTGYDCTSPCADVTDTAVKHLYIHDNLIEDNVHAGIYLDDNAAHCGIRVLRNNILDNDVFGLSNFAICDARNTTAGGDWVETATKVWVFGADLPTNGEVDVIFKYNNVVGNTYWGVKNWERDNGGRNAGAMFNAKENFWNALDAPAGGPSMGPEHCAHMPDQRSEAFGLGDAVDKGTFYNPWLAEEWELLTELPDQGLRAYGSDSLKLQAGWNTLAVPFDVDNNYDEIGELLALGYFLNNEVKIGDAEGRVEVERFYEYDNTGDAWQQNPQLKAARGYYIKLKFVDPDGDWPLVDDAGMPYTKFPVIYSTDRGTGLPHYHLKADDPTNDAISGWNLIGAAFGLDETDDTSTGSDYDQARFAVADPDIPWRDDDAVMRVDAALESIEWGDTEGAYGVAMVGSPGMPGQIDGGWMLPYVDAVAVNMYTGQAYWVFMMEDATLAGHVMMPLYLPYQPNPLPLW